MTAREAAVAAMAETLEQADVATDGKFSAYGPHIGPTTLATTILAALDAHPAAKAALAAWLISDAEPSCADCGSIIDHHANCPEGDGHLVWDVTLAPDTAPIVARNRAASSGAQLLATSCVECGHSRDRHPDGADCGENDGCQEFIWPDTAPVVIERETALREDAGYLADAAVHMADHMKSLDLYCEDAGNVRHFAAKVYAALTPPEEEPRT